MTQAITHLLIREYYTCFNEQRFEDGAELFAVDAVLEHPPFGPTRRGGGGYVEFAEMWVRAFPDGQFTIDHVEQRGDTICEVDLMATGTHDGDLDMHAYGVIRATGAKTRLRCRELLEIRAGKITYSSLSFDVHELIGQIKA